MELSIHTRMLRIPLYIWNHPQPLSHMVQHAADRFAPFPPSHHSPPPSLKFFHTPPFTIYFFLEKKDNVSCTSANHHFQHQNHHSQHQNHSLAHGILNKVNNTCGHMSFKLSNNINLLQIYIYIYKHN